VLINWFRGLGFAVARIGLEAGPLSQWLYAGMRDVGLPVELLETRHGWSNDTANLRRQDP
jgi:hypothetical protein